MGTINWEKMHDTVVEECIKLKDENAELQKEIEHLKKEASKYEDWYHDSQRNTNNLYSELKKWKTAYEFLVREITK